MHLTVGKVATVVEGLMVNDALVKDKSIRRNSVWYGEGMKL